MTMSHFIQRSSDGIISAKNLNGNNYKCAGFAHDITIIDDIEIRAHRRRYRESKGMLAHDRRQSPASTDSIVDAFKGDDIAQLPRNRDSAGDTKPPLHIMLLQRYHRI